MNNSPHGERETLTSSFASFHSSVERGGFTELAYHEKGKQIEKRKARTWTKLLGGHLYFWPACEVTQVKVWLECKLMSLVSYEIMEETRSPPSLLRCVPTAQVERAKMFLNSQMAPPSPLIHLKH